MNIDNVFNEVIEKLKQDIRPHLHLTTEDHVVLKNQWSQINESQNFQELFKILCILDNTNSLNLIHQENISHTLKNCNDEEISVLTLGVARKHIIEASHKNSNRVSMDFLEVLKHMLKTNSSETLEWTLRLIESLGSQSIILKPDVLKAKPGMLASFNSHKKAAKQIIELLERRWGNR
ncbi:hypothetical protein [Bacteriovorax sp. Seq25_V]|uniref:hypothetical protein n=1 Tax=Bacteriovorax sp. Seq25_V TaxID=1201288 RepID=UPI00038A45B8|nr:hypothetical protein [Bacteriovorax sp. Seq25_V]EQC43767.1 hypothetical protein M900_1226 [Bacteriovorax sp. Seq25_V]